MNAIELYSVLSKAGIEHQVVEAFEGSRLIRVSVEEYPDRDAMVAALVRKEIDWIVGDPTHENINDTVQFFAKGGFGVYSDEDIKEQFDLLVTP